MAEQVEQEGPARWERKESRVILLPVDGSPHSYRAFDWYESSIMRPGDTVVLFTAFELPVMQASYNNDPDMHFDSSKVLQIEQEKARNLLAPYKVKCYNLADLSRYKTISEGGKKPGEQICKCIKDEKVDMIIMGSRGMGKVRRTFLGSVSDYIVHHSNVPVIVVPPPS